MKKIAFVIGALALTAAAGAAFAQPIMEVSGGNVVVPATTSRFGLGTDTPAQQFHVKSGGQPTFQFEQTGSSIYNFKINGAGQFTIAKQGDGSPPAFKVISNSAPNVVIVGGPIQAAAFNLSSSRTFKENFVDVDHGDVLQRVVELPIARWNLIEDPNATQHIGPMAEDFHAAFGVGSSDKQIAVNDMTGVALAAIQGLYDEVQAKDQVIASLLERVEDLERRLDAR